MFRFHDRPSLSDLFETRAALRRQEVVLQGALQDVQTELRSWQIHRQAQAAAGRPVPHELCMLWDELGERERQLCLDIVQVRAALKEANRELQAHVRMRPLAS